MRRSKCGTNYPPISDFCAKCGSALAKHCAKCEAENPPTANFCAKCGASLTNGVGAAVTSSSSGLASRVHVAPESSAGPVRDAEVCVKWAKEVKTATNLIADFASRLLLRGSGPAFSATPRTSCGPTVTWRWRIRRRAVRSFRHISSKKVRQGIGCSDARSFVSSPLPSLLGLFRSAKSGTSFSGLLGGAK